MRTAIVGAGSLGTIIGALMTHAGRSVDLIDANAAHVSALNSNGARVTGEINLHVPISAYLPEAMSGTYDLIFLLTKQTTNHTVLPNLVRYLHDGSTVCTLQNGIPEPFVADVVGAGRTMGGAVGFGATWIEPGVSRLTTTEDAMRRYAFEIGEIDGIARPRLAMARDYLSCVGHTELLDDLMAIRWSKLLMNTTFSGMSAALGCTFGEVLDDPSALRCVAFIANETVRAAHAAGHRLAPMQGEDFERFGFDGNENIDAILSMIRRIWSRHRQLRASMLQDLEKGLDTEIDFINGVVCTIGRRFGLPTPFNDRVVEIVRAAQSERKVPNFSNISLFEGVSDSF